MPSLCDRPQGRSTAGVRLYLPGSEPWPAPPVTMGRMNKTIPAADLALSELNRGIRSVFVPAWARDIDTLHGLKPGDSCFTDRDLHRRAWWCSGPNLHKRELPPACASGLPGYHPPPHRERVHRLSGADPSPCKCELFDIGRGVQVPVVGRPAVRARPFPALQRQIGLLVAAERAGL